MRALRFEPRTVSAGVVRRFVEPQFHDNPRPKSDVIPTRSLRRANGHEKKPYASIGRTSWPLFSNAAVDMPKPYDGRLYVSCHAFVPSVRRPTSTVIPGAQLAGFADCALINENGLTGRMNDGVTPARTNHKLLALVC